MLRDGEAAPTKLWTALRRLHDVGGTKTAKLLARKRPALIPIYDSVLEEQLGPWNEHWDRYCGAFESADLDLAVRLAALRARAGVDHITLLGVLNALTWRIGKGHDLRVGV